MPFSRLQVRGQKDMDAFVRIPGYRRNLAQAMPSVGRETGFLDEFPFCTVQRGFPGINGPGGNFPDILSKGVAVLVEQDDAGFIQQRNNGGCAGVLDKLHVGGDAIVQGDVFLYQAVYFPLMDVGAVVYLYVHIFSLSE
jgi:hypothetical protein